MFRWISADPVWEALPTARAQLSKHDRGSPSSQSTPVTVKDHS